MSRQMWQETLVSSTVAGSAFGNFTTAKTVIPANAVYTFYPGYFEIGRALDIEVWGSLSNIVTTPGTVSFQVMLNAVIAFTTGALIFNDTAHTTLPFYLKIAMTCRAVGLTTAANFMGMGFVIGKMFTVTADQVDGANTHTCLNAPITAPAVGTGWDSSIAQVMDFFTGFSIGDAGNVVQIQNYFVTSRN